MKYITIKKTAFRSIAILLYMFIVVSCSDNDIIDSDIDGDKISFSISDNALFHNSTKVTNKTRSSQVSTYTLKCDDENTLQIETLVQKNTQNWLLQTDGSVKSRAASYSSTNQISSFNVTALYANNALFLENLIVDASASSSDKYWPADALNFFAYSKSNDKGTLSDVSFSKTDDKYKGAFTNYALPAPSIVASPDDAEQQPDLVFAITPNKTSSDGAVALNFHHALSAVKFKLKSTADGVTFNKISLKDVYGSGSCSFEATGTNNDEMIFVWTPTTSDQRTYVQSVNEALIKDLEYPLPDSKVFMQIPQTLNADATIVMDYTIGTTTYTKEVKLSEITSQWEANKKYTYTISISVEAVEESNSSNSYIMNPNGAAIRIPVSRANISTLMTQPQLSNEDGALTNVANDVKVKGLLYQWGRKDPFPGSPTIKDNTETELYNADGKINNSIPQLSQEVSLANASLNNVANAVANAVANPKVLYRGVSTNKNDWYSNHYGVKNNSLWSDGATKKSVFDPCPLGWRVPQFEDFSNFADNSNFEWNKNDANRGVTHTTYGFWPAAGYRIQRSGELSSVGSYGHYWSATPDASDARHLFFTSTGIFTGFKIRTPAFSVLCSRQLS